MDNAPPPTSGQTTPGGSGLAITGLVLAVCGIIPFLGIVTGLAGLIIGIVVLASRRAGKGMAIAAIICGLILPVLPTVAVAAIVYRVAGVTRGFQGKARNAVTSSTINMSCIALEQYYTETGRYPTNDEGLEARVTKPDSTDGRKWNGPYMNTRPSDAWGNELGYELTDPASEEAETLPFKVWSFGPDGQDDSGDNDDIRNRAWVRSGSGRM